MNIGEKIKYYRINKGFTQRKLADNIEKSIESIKKYEKGSINPPINVLKKIAATLEIEIDDLISTMDKLLIPGDKRFTQKPKEISDEDALLCIMKLLDYAGLDITLEIDEIKRITKITKYFHKSLIEDIKLNSDYVILNKHSK